MGEWEGLSLTIAGRLKPPASSLSESLVALTVGSMKSVSMTYLDSCLLRPTKAKCICAFSPDDYAIPSGMHSKGEKTMNSRD